MKNYYLAFLFIILLVWGCKKIIDTESLQLKDSKNIYSDYLSAFSKNKTSNTDLLKPGLMDCSLAQEVNIPGLGTGYLIPSTKQLIPKLSIGQINIFGFYKPSDNSIYQITAVSDTSVVELKALIENLKGNYGQNPTISYSIMDRSGSVIKQFSINDSYPLVMKKQLLNGVNNNNVRVNSTMKVLDEGCLDDNTYTVVRFYTNATGQVVSYVIIAVICLDTAPYGDGGGGSSGDNQVDLHHAIMASTSCLDSAQDKTFGTTVNQYYDDNCGNKYIYNYYINHKVQLKVCTDSTGAELTDNRLAEYKSLDKSLNIRNSALSFVNIFEEEFFHGFQDLTYNGGTAQYNTTANGNIEFEQRFFYDIINSNPFNTFTDPTIKDQYEQYIIAVTNNYTTKPTSTLDLAQPGYQSYAYFVEKYAQQLNQKTNSSSYHFDNTVQPEAAINVFSSYNPNCN